MTGRRSLLLGIAAVAAYTVVAVITLGGGGRVRPLFDGFAPPPPYRCVNPPKELVAGNIKPTPAVVDVPLGAGGSAVRGIATDDGQFVLSLPQGAVRARDSETKPSGQPVEPLVKPGTLGMSVPEATQVLLYSPDGRAWTRLTTKNLGGPVNPDTRFDQPGYNLGATPNATASTSGGSGTTDRVVAVAVITVAVTVGMWILPAVRRRRRRRG